MTPAPTETPLSEIPLSETVRRKQFFFDRWAATYDWLIPSVFYQAVHKRLLDYVELSAGARVLDLGCGTGRLLNRIAAQFPDCWGTGIDLSPEMLRQARRHNCHRPRLIYVQGNAEALPFTTHQFHAVFNTISFLHYPHPDQVMAEVSRVLTADGRFYLVDYTSASDRPLLISPGGIRFYSSAAREQLGTQAGLRCLGHYYLLGRVLLTVFAKPI